MLTTTEQQHAEHHGWTLAEVYDLQTQRLDLSILPINFEMGSAAQAMQHVMDLAKRGDTVAMKALTLVAKSRFQRRGK